MHRSEPVIKQALGDDWHLLDPVARRHYDLSSGKDLLVLLAQLLTTIAKLLGPGDARAVVADSLVSNAQHRHLNHGCSEVPQL